MLATRFPDRVPERQPELDGTVELPTELADVRDAEREARHPTDRQLSGAQVREVERVARRERRQDRACGRSPEAEAGVGRGDVVESHAAVVRRVLADPGEVVATEGRPRDDSEAILAEPGDREVALDSAACVQHLRVRDRADVPDDAVGAEALEQRRRALAGNLELGERGLVEESRRLAAGAVLGADRRRPVSPGPAARAQALVTHGRIRLEPVRALPARFLAERGSELLQPAIRRRNPKRPPRARSCPGYLTS